MNQEQDEQDIPLSKTKIKKQMIELQELGERLTALNKEQLNELDLPEKLRDALDEVKRMSKFGAINRQMQYIGKLMREVDAAPIHAKLEIWSGNSRQYVAWMHQLEKWRERLLAEPEAIHELLAQYPQADSQHLRTLVRNAHKEKQLNKPPKNFREIFQALKEVIPEQS